jgi:hypothetical protein
MTGVLTCKYEDGYYRVSWSIDQLGIEGYFSGDKGDDYRKVLSTALKIREG